MVLTWKVRTRILQLTICVYLKEKHFCIRTCAIYKGNIRTIENYPRKIMDIGVLPLVKKIRQHFFAVVIKHDLYFVTCLAVLLPNLLALTWAQECQKLTGSLSCLVRAYPMRLNFCNRIPSKILGQYKFMPSLCKWSEINHGCERAQAVFFSALPPGRLTAYPLGRRQQAVVP